LRNAPGTVIPHVPTPVTGGNGDGGDGGSTRGTSGGAAAGNGARGGGICEAPREKTPLEKLLRPEVQKADFGICHLSTISPRAGGGSVCSYECGDGFVRYMFVGQGLGWACPKILLKDY
jgi:hypothetical protein